MEHGEGCQAGRGRLPLPSTRTSPAPHFGTTGQPGAHVPVAYITTVRTTRCTVSRALAGVHLSLHPPSPVPRGLQETDAWLSTLFDLIPLLDKEVLKTEVLSLALSKGDVEGAVGSKTICVRILGALAPRLVGALLAGRRGVRMAVRRRGA